MSAARPRMSNGRAHSARCRSNSCAQSAQSAPRFFRCRTRRARRLDPRARHHPADRGAAGRGRARRLRDHRRRAALARRAARRPARSADRRPSTSATAKRSSSRSSRTCSAPISMRWKRRRAIRRSADEFNHSQDDIAKIVGKSRSHVANTMRLLKLPAEVKAYIAHGNLSAGHARALIGVPNPLAAAKRIVARRPQRAPGEALAQSKACRSASRRSRQRRQDQGPRYGRAGEACRDALGLDVTRQPSRPRRLRADQLPQPRTARRGDAAAGEGELSVTLSSVVPALSRPIRRGPSMMARRWRPRFDR